MAEAREAKKGLVGGGDSGVPEPLVDALLRRAAWRHIRAVVPSGAYITFPAAPVALNLDSLASVPYSHFLAHVTVLYLVCGLRLEKKNTYLNC